MSNIIKESIEKSLREGEIYLVYQPKYDLEDGNIESLEALIRWRKEGNNVPPNLIIEEAEKSNVILELGKYVIHEVCKQQKEWKSKNIDIKRVDINVSIKNLRDKGFVNYLDSTIAEYGLKRSDIGIEITERKKYENRKETNRNIKELNKKGYKLMIDDFGKGYNKEEYLIGLDVENVKVELQELVKEDIQEGLKKYKSVTVERIENKEEEDYVKEKGFRYVQGYYYSKPLEKREIEKKLKERG